MNHGDHGGHGGHDMPMGPKCSMNMLWNTQIVDTCIVFPSWHIGSNASFVLSFFIIVLLGVFYEYLRAFQHNVDVRIAASLDKKGKGKRILLGGSRSGSGSGRSTPEESGEEVGLLTLKPVAAGVPVPPTLRVLRAALYGATVFLSFFLMLVFMTYNAYLILAVVAGAGIGHFIFGSHMDPEAILSGSGSKGMACH
ncbi:hypothetical protein ONZ45_g6997 [Pleurotus djamor]|nr:hypothetical protein ONZ45_g6997 [Pleurotus djamor]